jgi:hypothetical protein
MSIAPISGVAAGGPAPAPTRGVAKPEAREASGAPDHDGDRDDHGTAAASGVKAAVGHVNIKA